MNPLPDKREQVIGWILAGLMALHLFELHPQPPVEPAAFAILLTGAVLRGRRIYAPRWFGHTLLVLGVLAVVLAQDRTDLGPSFPILLGKLAATVGTILLLRPVTPLRCQRVLFCLLLVLVASILSSPTEVGQTFIVLDVGVMYLVLEEAFRPPDALIGFWVSLTRSFRVIVPVGIVVLALFWLYPGPAIFSPTVFTGFTGSDTLDAGTVAELSQSSRIALSVHFAENQPIPPADSLYWRGQVMESNSGGGFHWSVIDQRVTRAQRLLAVAPAHAAGIMLYSEELAENRGIVPVLDHAIFIDAKRNGLAVAVLDNGAGTLSSVGVGSLSLQVASAAAPLSDAPDERIQDGYRHVPREVRESAPIQEIAAQIFAHETNTFGKLRALSHYFQTSGFRYTLRPGRIQSMTKFLTEQRAGFCSHYATAAANLLRLAQVPTRVVSGYRGGEWNPWLRTITVRDSDAHAWVEAWDEPSHRWLRFDPTDAVAPELSAGIRREMDSSQWPWYRRDWSHGHAVATEMSDAIARAWDRLTSSADWDNVPTVLFIALVSVALFWLIGHLRARRALGPQENIARLLIKLEHRAARLHRERQPGETPLAWLDRLAHATSIPEEKQTLHDFARSYESSMYQSGGTSHELLGKFRQDRQRLVKLWKRPPAFRV